MKTPAAEMRKKQPTSTNYVDGIEALQPTDLDRAVSGSDDADVDDLRLMVCGADQKVRFVVYCST